MVREDLVRRPELVERRAVEAEDTRARPMPAETKRRSPITSGVATLTDAAIRARQGR